MTEAVYHPPTDQVELYSRCMLDNVKQMGSKLFNTVTPLYDAHGPCASSDDVEIDMHDCLSGDWIDDVESMINGQLLMDSNPDSGIARDANMMHKAGAYAIGRTMDTLIVNELDTSNNFAGDGADGLTKAKVLEAFDMMGENDVPDDGDRYAIVGWKQWSDLLQIDEFTKADYVGEEDLPWKGTQAKKWLGTLWMPHSGLTKFNDVRYCYWYHKTAIAHAIGDEVYSEFKWHGDRGAHFVSNKLSHGSDVINPRRVVAMRCNETG